MAVGYTKRNLRDVENAAPKFDMPSEMDARSREHRSRVRPSVSA